jgi:hypothetical protein
MRPIIDLKEEYFLRGVLEEVLVEIQMQCFKEQEIDYQRQPLNRGQKDRNL